MTNDVTTKIRPPTTHLRNNLLLPAATPQIPPPVPGPAPTILPPLEGHHRGTRPADRSLLRDEMGRGAVLRKAHALEPLAQPHGVDHAPPEASCPGRRGGQLLPEGVRHCRCRAQGVCGEEEGLYRQTEGGAEEREDRGMSVS